MKFKYLPFYLIFALANLSVSQFTFGADDEEVEEGRILDSYVWIKIKITPPIFPSAAILIEI